LEVYSGRAWRCGFVLLLFGFSVSSSIVLAKSIEETMCADCLSRVEDRQSNLECTLTILRAADGGASAVDVELSNRYADHDVVLRVNTEMSAFIMLTVTDDQGTVLSKPAKKFDHSETQNFDIRRLKRGQSHRWRVPLAAQLEESVIPVHGLKGRLVVNVALLFSKLSGDEEPANSDFKLSIVTLYDMDVTFTRSALSGP
jgi:hypothetical protein